MRIGECGSRAVNNHAGDDFRSRPEGRPVRAMSTSPSALEVHGDVRIYMPGSHAGVIVLRLASQDLESIAAALHDLSAIPTSLG